jgi:hypothetical protein
MVPNIQAFVFLLWHKIRIMFLLLSEKERETLRGWESYVWRKNDFHLNNDNKLIPK